MEESYKEKIFNLQLTVQKLEEELLLYRNGTSVAELLELIHEKDVEIETLNIQNEEKNNKLKKLAKTSGDVLMKYDSLQSDLQKKQDLIYELELILQNLQQSHKEKEEYIQKEIKEKQVSLMKELNEKNDLIGQLQLQIWEEKQIHDQHEIKWNEVKQISEMEKNEIIAEKEELNNEISKLNKDKDEKVRIIERQLIEMSKLKEENSQLLQSVDKYKELLVDSDQSIEKLQKRCATLIAEKNDKYKSLDVERQDMIKNIQQFRDSMTNNLTQRDDALRRKDDKIRELNLQISILQQELKVKGGNPNIILTKATAPVASSKSVVVPVFESEIVESNKASETISSNVVVGKEKDPSTKGSSKSRVALSERTNSVDAAVKDSKTKTIVQY